MYVFLLNYCFRGMSISVWNTAVNVTVATITSWNLGHNHHLNAAWNAKETISRPAVDLGPSMCLDQVSGIWLPSTKQSAFKLYSYVQMSFFHLKLIWKDVNKSNLASKKKEQQPLECNMLNINYNQNFTNLFWKEMYQI